MNRYFSPLYFLIAALLCCFPAMAAGWFLAQASFVVGGFFSVVSIGVAFLCMIFASDAGRGQEATVSHLVNGIYTECPQPRFFFIRNERGDVGYVLIDPEMLPIFEVKKGEVYKIPAPPNVNPVESNHASTQ